MANQVLTHVLSQPLEGVTSARVEINAGDGNLAIDPEVEGMHLMASGILQYGVKQGAPTCNLDTGNGQAAFTLQAGSGPQGRFRLPWKACLGGYSWTVHLNPSVPVELKAHSNGGNVKANLAAMRANRLSIDTGGGNLDVVLPTAVANLDAAIKTGGGNLNIAVGASTSGKGVLNAQSGAGDVVVSLPGGIAARVQATSGAGKVILDERFSLVAKGTYQTADFNTAADKLEISLNSGAGNVRVNR